MAWNARPEYEQRQQVISIDLVGGKVVRRMAPVERPASPDDEESIPAGRAVLEESSGNRGDSSGGGAFSKNPLLGALIKPVFDPKGKGVSHKGRKVNSTKWRRVQDDLDDNEDLILDGGVHGPVDEAQGT